METWRLGEMGKRRKGDLEKWSTAAESAPHFIPGLEFIPRCARDVTRIKSPRNATVPRHPGNAVAGRRITITKARTALSGIFQA